MERNARRCFVFHAEHIHLIVDKELGIVERRSLEDGPHIDVGETVDVLGSPRLERQRSVDKYLDLDELERAVMDLGASKSRLSGVTELFSVFREQPCDRCFPVA